jgi:hypothetical protein
MNHRLQSARYRSMDIGQLKAGYIPTKIENRLPNMVFTGEIYISLDFHIFKIGALN